MVASVDDDFAWGHRREPSKLFHDNVHRNVYIDPVSRFYFVIESLPVPTQLEVLSNSVDFFSFRHVAAGVL